MLLATEAFATLAFRAVYLTMENVWKPVLQKKCQQKVTQFVPGRTPFASITIIKLNHVSNAEYFKNHSFRNQEAACSAVPLASPTIQR